MDIKFLEPCPFCGSDPEVSGDIITCSYCKSNGLSVSAPNNEEWNTRKGEDLEDRYNCGNCKYWVSGYACNDPGPTCTKHDRPQNSDCGICDYFVYF